LGHNDQITNRKGANQHVDKGRGVGVLFCYGEVFRLGADGFEALHPPPNNIKGREKGKGKRGFNRMTLSCLVLVKKNNRGARAGISRGG